MPAPSQAWPDLVFADQADAARVMNAVKRGTLVRLARGVFTGDRSASPVDIVQRHLWRIVGHEFPGAVIADRSVRTGGLGREGRLFIVHPTPRPVALPGVVVYPRPGHRAVHGDIPLPGGIWMSSTERALLDNLVARRQSNLPQRTLPRDDLEDWIKELLHERGETGLKELLERAHDVASPLGRTDQLPELERLVESVMRGPDVDLTAEAWLHVSTP